MDTQIDLLLQFLTLFLPVALTIDPSGLSTTGMFRTTLSTASAPAKYASSGSTHFPKARYVSARPSTVKLMRISPIGHAGAKSEAAGPLSSGFAIVTAMSLMLGGPVLLGASTAYAAEVSVFEGQYSDPFHPGCLRKVESSGKVSGTDGKPGCSNGEPTKARIDEEAKDILIDFRPKGGPKDLLGKWTVSGIRFPDGNTWKKIDSAQ
eukprot:gene14081-20031_t